MSSSNEDEQEEFDPSKYVDPREGGRRWRWSMDEAEQALAEQFDAHDAKQKSLQDQAQSDEEQSSESERPYYSYSISSSNQEEESENSSSESGFYPQSGQTKRGSDWRGIVTALFIAFLLFLLLIALAHIGH